jgi:hypothetical protein
MKTNRQIEQEARTVIEKAFKRQKRSDKNFAQAFEEAKGAFKAAQNQVIRYYGEITNTVFSWTICRHCKRFFPSLLCANHTDDAKCKVLRGDCMTCVVHHNLDLNIAH